MRILFLAAFKSDQFRARYGDPRDSDLGGSRKVTLILRAMLKAGHQIKLVSSAIAWQQGSGMQSVPVHDQAFPEGTVTIDHASTVRRRPLGGMLIGFFAARKAVRISREWQPDLIFSYNSLLAEALTIAAVQRRRKIPLVLEVDDLPGVRGNPRHPKAIIDRKLWPGVVGRSAGFVFVNQQVRQKVATGQRPTLLLPGAIEESLLALARNRQAPFSSPRRTVLYAGGLSVGRGAGVLLDAIPKLPPNWQMVVAGAGALDADFRAATASNPATCRYLGLLKPEALYQELAAADVVLNTPEQLNDAGGVFPFKILEYLVCGGHVISPKLPPLDAQDTSWFQRWSGNAKDLPRLLEESEQTYLRETPIRQSCAQWVESNFSLGAVGQSLNRLFRDCGAKVGN